MNFIRQTQKIHRLAAPSCYRLGSCAATISGDPHGHIRIDRIRRRGARRARRLRRHHALAHDPALLKRTWESLKQIMAPGALDPLTKEMIYIAVSVTNNCNYCIASHTASAFGKGMTDAMFKELQAIIGMANETNKLVTGYQVEVDQRFQPPLPR